VAWYLVKHKDNFFFSFELEADECSSNFHESLCHDKCGLPHTHTHNQRCENHDVRPVTNLASREKTV
jgi:hypothetical protein